MAVSDASVLLDVNGLGFDILCSRGALSLCEVGRRARLTTQVQFSEAGAAIFGFMDERERELFLKITTIKGIGGRTAMNILAVLSVEEIIRAVSLADVGTFMRAPGVGRKTAERLCFELKGAFPKDFTSVVETTGVTGVAPKTQTLVEDALRGLGFTASDAAAAVAMVRAARGEDFEKLDEATLLRSALKELQGGK